ncbi:phosphotransferase family protein [Brachybacterium huguangmaarense]
MPDTDPRTENTIPDDTVVPRAALAVASDATGEALREAWRSGALGHVDGETGAGTADVRAAVTGVGESFVAWRLTPSSGPELVVRIPWRPIDDLAQPIGDEFPALAHVPPGVGPQPVRLVSDPAETAVGRPLIVTTYLPGRVLAPAQWSPAHLLAHARRVAELHAPVFDGRGKLAPGGPGTPEEARHLVRGPMSMLAEVDGAFGWWRANHPEVTDTPLAARLMDAARAECERAEATGAFARLTSFTLAHGDLCATNVVWEDAGTGPDAAGPTCHDIDFEWAQADDPARDVAIIGGAVHGGPWYVPMDEDAVAAFCDEYVRESRRLRPDAPLDARDLRIRRDAWEAYERTAMLLHSTRRAAEGDPEHAAVLPGLRERLARRLGVALG